MVLRGTTFGFLAVTQVPTFGYCGGLLALNAGGRPLEFHCTAPVTANRAQQILFGATLKEFLVCDLIAESLLTKVGVPLDVLIIEDRTLSPIKQKTDVPVVVVENRVRCPAELPGEHLTSSAVDPFEILAGPPESTEAMLRQFMETLPIHEPFERIYQAIEAAHAEASHSEAA